MEILSTLTNCRVLSTVTQEESMEKWLAARKLGIGGSDVGSICGVNKYSSAKLVYLKKLGLYEDKFDEFSLERMEWGNLLEPVVATKFEKVTGKKVAISPATLQHKDYDFGIANIDRFIVDEHGVPYGVLECKTADARLNKDWEDGEFPISYLYQLMWYLWVTGLKYGAIACVVGGNKFHYYEVFFDDELVLNNIVPTVEKFWNENILKLVEPEISGSEADVAYVKDKYDSAGVIKDSKKAFGPDDDMDDLAAQRAVYKDILKKTQADLDLVENKIKEKMGNIHIGHTANYIIKWTPTVQNRVDGDLLKALYPGIIPNVMKKIEFRTLTVKES